MIRVERNGLVLLAFPQLEEAGLVCAVSTRPLDVRQEDGRRRLAEALGLDPSRVVSPRQVHHADVARVDAAGDLEPVDGVVTDVAGLPLMLRAADCSLVLVHDPEHRAFGLAHAGWKGSARGVVVNLVRALTEHYGTDPARCLAVVGPTISAPHYPVGADVPAAFLRTRAWAREHVRVVDGRFHFDLSGTNAHFLRECGIPDDAIEVCGLCTFATPDLLHSFRRDGTGGGHHGMIAALQGAV